MVYTLRSLSACILLYCTSASFAQKSEMVRIVKDGKENKVDILIGQKLFTSFLSYHANWTNQQNEVLLEETTRYEFSCKGCE